MREDFLHYLWKYKKFDTSDLYTTNSEPVTIINAGYYHQLAGPDFFNAQLIIGSQKWAGNVEIHLKASDWYLHHHESDRSYENVILHVVWDYDVDIYRQDSTEIPVLELKNFVASETLENFEKLTSPKAWIFCERQLDGLDAFVLKNWLERLFFERLEHKTIHILQLYEQMQSDWEATLFSLLAKNFGLNTNGEAFLKIAMQIPLTVIRKECKDVVNIEALLFGYAHLLDEPKQDAYFSELQRRFSLLKQKHNLGEPSPIQVQFFKHRPDNFPTIRLAQLAMLYHCEHQLFSSLVTSNSIFDYYRLFNVAVSDYWQSHFQFDRQSPTKRKALSRSFIDLLLINTVVPLRFAFAKRNGTDISEELISLLSNIKCESNSITTKFAEVKITASNAMESQSLLSLKHDYCDRGRCLQCAIGMELLGQTQKQNV